MSKRGRREPDPFHDIREWQDHRYDPGYFLGGRIHPLIKAGRPNRYGWVLLAFGLLGFVLIFLTPREDTAWWQYAGAAALLLLYVTAGFKLLRGKKRPTPSGHYDRQGKGLK